MTIGDNDKMMSRSAWWLKKLYPHIINLLDNQGLVYRGAITDVGGTPTEFKSSALIGFGDDHFNDKYYVYAIDSAAAAPHGEVRVISDYVSATGSFSYAAFSVALTTDDEVLIMHESVILPYLHADGAGGYPASVADNSIFAHIMAIGGDTSDYDNATMSLEALNADLDAILADVGDASASTLTSIYAILGNPSASLSTTILDGIDARVNNANLNALLGVTDAAGRSINGNVGDFQAQTNLQTLLAALGIPDTSGKPLYTCLVTDRLDNATFGLSALNDDLDAIIANQAGTETVSSYDLPNDTAENTLLEISNTKRVRLDSVWLDFVNLVQDVTIKVYHKIDGTNYRQYDSFSWGTSEEDGVLLSPVTINNDWKVTVTSTVAQGSILAIPYNVIKTTMEA